MSPTIKTILDMAEQIKIENTKSKDKIPSSDTFVKRMSAYLSRTDEEVRKFLNDLRDCHYIFLINIVQPELNTNIQSIDAYVYAEPSILTELKRFADKKLETLYEGTFYKRKSAFQIIRELFTKVKEYNNTPFGRAINEAVMIEEYHRLITSNPYEFTETWKKEKLYRLYEEEEVEETKTSLRAVDQAKKIVEGVNPNSRWGKAVNQFSIEFLVRIHFRKYEFDVIKKLVLSGKINKEADLKYIRDTLKMMETRLDEDTALRRYLNEMIDLRRLAQGKLNLLRKNHSVL